MLLRRSSGERPRREQRLMGRRVSGLNARVASIRRSKLRGALVLVYPVCATILGRLGEILGLLTPSTTVTNVCAVISGAHKI